MAPKYKLTYFDFTGLGEPIRFLFHYAGVEFIDNRISQEDWLTIKPTTPSGQLPILEFDGHVLCQSLAILRYLAKQLGLAGSNDLENYEIDKVADTVNDLRMGIITYRLESDPEKKKAIKALLLKEKLPGWLGPLDSWAKKNNGVLANGKVSWADLYFVPVVGYLSVFLDYDLLQNYPNLQAVKSKILCNPGIKAWVDRRPKDVFP